MNGKHDMSPTLAIGFDFTNDLFWYNFEVSIKWTVLVSSNKSGEYLS